MVTWMLSRTIILLLNCVRFLEETEYTENGNIDNINELEDYHFMCGTWAENGLCDDVNDYNYDVEKMLDQCPKSCFVSTMIEDILVDAIQGAVECTNTRESYNNNDEDVPSSKNHEKQCSFGVPQYVDIADPMALSTLQVIRQTTFYYSDHENMIITEGCKNKKEDCSYLAAIGMCQSHVIYMELNCSPACQSCHSYQKRIRCNNNITGEDDNEGTLILWPSGKGDLNSMFTNIMEMEESKIKTLSNPFAQPKNKYQWRSLHQNLKQTRRGPWLLAYDNFLSINETDTLIRLGETLGFQPSTISSSSATDYNLIHHINDDIPNKKWRTSETTWCDYDCIEKNEIMKKILQRVVNLTGMDMTNIEPVQLLRYKVGQFYVEHHDYIPYDRYLPSGPRILTAFIYLNDLPHDGGGGTHFPFHQHPTLTVTPKKGTMLIWPNVLDLDPSLPDDRMRHEALPVNKGIKYGANIWFHLRDYQSAYEKKCT